VPASQRDVASGAEDGRARRDHRWLPSVSVIVPMLDAERVVESCLEAVLSQTFPEERTEVIFVDNGSRDGTCEIIQRSPVIFVEEHGNKSPYAARNAGIAVARGDVVALTDVSCAPARDWLERGVAALEERRADLVGGRIEFVLPPNPTVGELVDALLNVDVEESITNHRACMTGNLFVRRELFDRLGLFEADLRSGGDIRWTRRATDAGFRLVYSADAVVAYPARPLGPLLRKLFRVGRGVPRVWSGFGMSHRRMWMSALRGLLPTPPARLAERIRRRAIPEMHRRTPQIWMALWLCKAVRAGGCVRGLLDRGSEPGLQPRPGSRPDR